MDYRNADGSLAEMCGNGIRVMARYLVERGHQPEGIFAINTRDGVKHLRVPATEDISVNMGKVLDEKLYHVLQPICHRSETSLCEFRKFRN